MSHNAIKKCGRAKRILQNRYGIFLLLCLMFWSSCAGQVSAADGMLDTTFGTGGKVVKSWVGNDSIQAILLQSSGKIVVGGFTTSSSGNRDFAVGRFTAAGAVDTTFGNAGIVNTDFFGTTDQIAAIAQQNDNKIVVVGTVYTGSRNSLALARYSPDGAIDTSFGTNGKVVRASASYENGDALVIQNDGKILTGGFSSTQFAVSRFLADGTPDNSFGIGGQGTVSFGVDPYVRAIVLQSDGKIVISGLTESGHGADFALARFNSNGFLDTGFGVGGKITTNFFGYADYVTAMCLQPDGKIVVGGFAFYTTTDCYFALARYNPNGSLDDTFGIGGKITTDFEGATARIGAITQQPDGKIVAIGEAYNGPNADFALARYNKDGTLDVSNFGIAGQTTTDFNGLSDRGYAVALQGDNKIVVGGTQQGSSGGFELARYTNTVSTLSVNNPRSLPEGSAALPGSVTFDISLDAPSAQTVTVNYQTTLGNTNPAIAGSDYVAKSGKLTFAPGETLKRVTISFIGDSAVELNETFFFDLKTPVNATIADSRGVGQINNDDGPGITIANAAAVNEGNSGTTPQTFAVTLSAASSDTVTVNWATADGTATTADYVAASGTLTFAPGETSKLITIQVNGDTAVEPNETYKVNLSKVAYAYITDGTGVGAIRNDDAAPQFFEDEPSQ